MGGADVPSFPGSNAQQSLGLLYLNQQLSTAEVIEDCEVPDVVLYIYTVITRDHA